jgi:hypothetical protein
MAWSFVLASQAGVTVDVLDGSYKQVQLETVRSDVSRAIVQIDVDDERALTLITQVAGATPRLYCYRDGILKFAGFLTSIEQSADNEAQLTATFEDALALLRYRVSRADVEYYSQNSASIIGSTSTVGAFPSLLTQANENAASGLTAGTITATTVTLDSLLISREVILDRVLEISKMTGGPDLRVNPQAQGSTLATLDVGPLYTATTPTISFGYGPGTAVNVLSVSQQITPPQTRVLVIGNEVESWSSVTADITNAETGVGRWEAVEQRSDLQSTTDCQNTADALVRTGWTQTISFTPDPAIAPVPLQDYNLGDPVRLTVFRGSIAADATVRVNKISVTIDNSGVETDHGVECEVGNAVVTAPATPKGTNTATNTDAPLTSSPESIATVVESPTIRLFRK